MSLTVHDNLVQGSDAWHDVRRGIVTASVVGRLVTPTLKVASNDYSRALTAQLVAERITGWTDPTYLSTDMQRGIDDEPRARDLYSKHYAEAVEVGFMTSDDIDGIPLGYSPDGLVGDDGLIEVKSRRAKKQLTTIISGQVPAENMAQLQTGLLVSGRKWIDYISYAGGMPLWVHRIYPDPAWFAAITAAVQTFEVNAAAMVAEYRFVSADLPPTERIVELEMSL